MDTDKAWEIWGARDPYFGVLTSDQYRAERFDAAQRAEFFRTGEVHIGRLLKRYSQIVGERCRYDSALDFGCGVGRLVIPLSSRFARVTGVDVSASMLGETQRNCELAGVKNVQLLPSSRFFAEDGSSFDFVHSVLVFQHIRPRRGMRLMKPLLARVAPGGMAAVQLIYSHTKTSSRLGRLKARVPFASRLAHALRNKPFVAPMEMNPYNLNIVLAMFQDQGMRSLQVSLSWIADMRSATIVGVKDA